MSRLFSLCANCIHHFLISERPIALICFGVQIHSLSLMLPSLFACACAYQSFPSSELAVMPTWGIYTIFISCSVFWFLLSGLKFSSLSLLIPWSQYPQPLSSSCNVTKENIHHCPSLVSQFLSLALLHSLSPFSIASLPSPSLQSFNPTKKSCDTTEEKTQPLP